jgi:dipeptidyl aminopeptidase/acylaminoacyl peptidase
LVEGTRITFEGETSRCPRFIDEDRIAYWVGALDHSQIRAIDAATGNDPEEIGRSTGVTCLSVAPGGRFVYHGSLDAHRDIYFFYDLFRIDRRTGRRTRLTHGLRAQEPDVSPDGRRVVFTVNGAATTHLAIAPVEDVEGGRTILVRSDRYEQIYTPRWSPDGRTVAYSTWQDGGYRDIHLVDVATGRVVEVTHDRALDTGPEWSRDGRTLFFSSDRTGIANIYAYDTVAGRTLQVTNVIGGAFQPAISPSGRRMVYLGYSIMGWDLWTLELDPARFRPAPAYVDTRPEPVDTEEVAMVASEEYEPLETILPRAFLLELGENGFGTELAITFEGSDVVGFHQYAGRVGVGLVRGEVNADLSYVYQHLPTPLSLRLFRTVAPRGGLFVGGVTEEWIEDAVGAEAGISYSMPRMLHFENVSARYSIAHLGKGAPFGGRLDPNDPPPRLPETGILAGVRLNWSWSDVVGTAYDISPSEGRSVNLGVSLAHPYLGSQFTAVTATWALTQYVENPFVQHHVVAMRYAGGMSGGDLGRRGAFAVGGFPEGEVLTQILDQIVFGGVGLRGYPPGHRRGTHFHLLQAEYRFPIARFMLGVSTLPAYLSRMWGAVFFDYGDAFFGQLDLGEFRAGVGGELHVDFQLGYVLAYSLRIGLARGLSEGGGTHFYTHIGVPF